MPLDRPVTVQLVVAVEQVKPPGDETTVYPLMAAPPLDDGAVHDTTDWVLAFDVAVTAVGAVGTVAGVAGADGLEAALVPAELVAVTANVYEVPLVRPDTVQLVVGVLHVKAPGAEVTV